jgi:hypothetical protein
MDNNQVYQSFYDPLNQQIDQYTNELIGEANGNYDFVAKWLENSYKLALGTDDQERAKFLKSVANDLESKVGRIQFDYNTNKYRTEQDIQTGTERTTQARDLALKRLSEDEATTRTQMAKEASSARQGTAESLSERGLLSGKLGQEGGLEGRTAQELETNIADKLSAYERTLGRNREDIGISSAQNLQDIQTTGQRNLEDLTTGARRSTIDTQSSYDQQLQQAQRQRDAAIAALKREQATQKKYAESYAQLKTSSYI